MFKDPFSFKGRIRRLEYLITIVIYCIVYFSLWFLTRGTTYGVEVFWSMFLISSYIFIAQGTKGCHDNGVNGFYQFILFYFFINIFKKLNNAHEKSHQATYCMYLVHRFCFIK